MERLLTCSIALFALITCQGQVSIDKPLVLTSPDPSLRQVQGLPSVTTSGAALAAGIESSGAHRYSTTPAGNTWLVDLPALIGAPTAGTQIIISSTTTSGTGPVMLSVNGSASYDIIWSPGVPFLLEHAVDMPMVSVVFDGSAFQVLNGKPLMRRECPTGTVAINEQSCMEIAERDTVSWFTAAQTCIAANMRLCTWGEWHNGCTKAALIGLQNMIGNWEWTNDAANEDLSVTMVGYGSCQQGGAWGFNNPPRYFRCCFTR